MLSDEMTVTGYVKVPYPYLDQFNEKVDILKGNHVYKDFPDFLMPPIECVGNAMLLFGYVFRYEPLFQNVMAERFERFLTEIRFLFASILIEVEMKDYIFIEYASDGETFHKVVKSIQDSTS